MSIYDASVEVAPSIWAAKSPAFAEAYAWRKDPVGRHRRLREMIARGTLRFSMIVTGDDTSPTLELPPKPWSQDA